MTQMRRDCQNDTRPSRSKPVREKGALKSLRRVVKAARSGLKRYPKALMESVRDPSSNRAIPAARELADISAHDFASVWLGHASVLLRVAGKTVLADPVLAHRIGVSVGGLTFGLGRHTPAPVHAEHLPPIDLILITHAHFDHLDKPTLRRLAARRGGDRTTVVTARRTARLVPRGFGAVVELDWDRVFRLGDLEISALRPAHWGARTALDRRRGYNSYTIRERGGASRPVGHGGVLLAGDTAMTDAFDGLDNLALAVLGIGAYEDWEHAHATPEEAWAMFRASGARHMLPVHHSTFAMGGEPVDEPMTRLLAAAGDEHHRVIRAAPGAVWAA